ncbi:MAG: hypothetical protein ACREJB_14165, partial [Planctomycetaceae bacterium]
MQIEVTPAAGRFDVEQMSVAGEHRPGIDERRHSVERLRIQTARPKDRVLAEEELRSAGILDEISRRVVETMVQP